MQANASLGEFYSGLWEMRDRRVENWPMMWSPWPTVALSATYVYFVTMMGPRLMKDREAFNLKVPIQIYNALSVLGSVYCVYECWMAGWGNNYNYLCQDVDRSADPKGSGMRMANVVWVYYISKFLEFFDTLFFIARKKFGNVSNLQVFHHGIMPIYSYVMCRWLPGGHESFALLLNSIVHVIMYSYYFMAMLGPQFQKYLWWKKYLTTFQMIQFVTIFVKSLIVAFGVSKCGYPWQMSLVSSVLMIIFFGLFFNFYMQEYSKKRSSSQKSASHQNGNGTKVD